MHFLCTDDSSVFLSEDNQADLKTQRKRAAKKKKRAPKEKEVNEKGRTSETEEEETAVEVEIDRDLDQALESKSKQHNLTTVNVKNIIHVSSRSFCPDSDFFTRVFTSPNTDGSYFIIRKR